MILYDIVDYRKEQLKREKSKIPFDEMKKIAEKTEREPISFFDALNGEKIAIIAEVKKASPSKSVIQPNFHPTQQARAYAAAGANAISCLTEEHYFQGSSKYLKDIRENVKIPILRKDFIIDEYQIYEARTIGADAILLIAAILDNEKMQRFANMARSLGLEILFEAHDEIEIERIKKCSPKIIGINNRNLKTFEVSLENTARLAKYIPDNVVFVSESGIKNHDDIKFVKDSGAKAVLIGETLMRSENVAETMQELRKDL